MDLFLDISEDHLNKKGEELCGDKVEWIRQEDNTIVVLADGLGSGVKANILATLTTKIAATLLKGGAGLKETADTLAKTLPVCQVRKLAYSTLGMVQIDNNGMVYAVENDTPPMVVIKDGKLFEPIRKALTINGRCFYESRFKLEIGDVIIMMSDGVIHAGVGGVLNLGWQWEQVAQYVERQASKRKSAKGLSKALLDTCNCLYMEKPGDDTTVLAIKMRAPERINMFTGPPENPENDSVLMNDFLSAEGKKIVSGGTAAKIVGNVIGEEVEVDMDTATERVPPIGIMKGIDLVTEGVLTISKTVEILREYLKSSSGAKERAQIEGNDGASRLARLLIDDCTHLTLYVGKAVNPAHQNPNLPLDLSIKLREVDKLVEILKDAGKYVCVKYY
jgi:hypothetical protein